MIDRATKLRWRRRMRRSRRQVEDIGFQAEENVERHLVRRLTRLFQVRRFVFAWILLLTLLTGGVIAQAMNLNRYYQTDTFVPGGSFTEGIIGAFTNANPLYASGAVDSSVSRLLFSGLMKYDQKNQLVGDLADTWTVDERGLVYTVTLKPNLVWQDGKTLSSDDVLFTYQTLQNPDARSPYIGSWQGIKVTTPNARTVVFTLPNVLVAFPYSLTNGIVPRHILGSVPVSQLRSARFNTADPIGSGPFRWEAVEVKGDTPETREEQIGLLPNQRYHAGVPKLEHYTVRSFRSEDSMLKAFRGNELTAMSGLDSLPDSLPRDLQANQYAIPLTGEVMVFFKTSGDILSDTKVRVALTKATNQDEILAQLGYPVIPAREPILAGQIGYAKDLTEFSYNLAEAKSLLDQAGWVPGKDGIRVKAGKPLTFTLTSQSTSEYAAVTKELQEEWRQVGADVKVNLQPESDLQTSLNVHAYDALLYGISIGADPDVFAYWDSSQGLGSANRLNFSDYKSGAADKALEAGRTRIDPAIRAIKYRPFLEAWRNDAPAIALYQPRFLYVTHGEVSGLNPKVMNTAVDRYANVHNWMIRQGKTDEL